MLRMERFSSLFRKYGNNFGLECFLSFFEYDRIYLAAIFIKTFLKLKISENLNYWTNC